jgi:hypothetical protein
MAQTPISASATIKSSTPTTIYTTPSGKTAIVAKGKVNLNTDFGIILLEKL